MDVTVRMVFAGCSVCPAGPDGNPGEEGQMGLPGLRGTSGMSGSPGRNGAPGSPGDIGPPGKPGKKGKSGPVGHPGVNGVTSIGKQGPKGPRGPPGPPGERGDQGNANDEEGIYGPQGISGEPGLPGKKGRRGKAGPQGVQGRHGAGRRECGCKELLMRKIPSVNASLSQRHETLHPLESKIQNKHLKNVLSELESIKVSGEKSEIDREEDDDSSEESSGEEIEEDETESLADSDEDLIRTPGTIEKDEEKATATTISPETSVEDEMYEDIVEKTTEAPTTLTTTPEATTSEEAPTTTTTTEAPTTTTEQATTVTIIPELVAAEAEPTPSAVPADVPLLSQGPKDEQLFETVVVVQNKKPNGRHPQRTSSRHSFTRGGVSNGSWRLPAPPRMPPRTLVQLNEREQFFDGANDADHEPIQGIFKDTSADEIEPAVGRSPQIFGEDPTRRVKVSAEAGAFLSSQSTGSRFKQRHPTRKSVDIGLIFAARERARQNMLDERRKKAQRERVERMKNRVVETMSFAALERAIDRVGIPHRIPHRSAGSRTVLSTVPLRNSRFNVLNMKPKRRIQKPYPQRPRLRQRAHAAKSFRKFQKKELVPPPVEEFVRSNEDQIRAFAIENEMREIARQRVGSQKIKSGNVDHHSVKKELRKEMELESFGRQETAVSSEKPPIQVTTPIQIGKPVETTTSTTTSRRTEVPTTTPLVTTFPTTTTTPMPVLESEKMEVKFVPENEAEKETLLVVEPKKEKSSSESEKIHEKDVPKDQWSHEVSILEKMQKEEHSIMENQRNQEIHAAAKEALEKKVIQKEEKVKENEEEQQTLGNKTLKTSTLPTQEEGKEDEEDQEIPAEKVVKAVPPGGEEDEGEDEDEEVAEESGTTERSLAGNEEKANDEEEQKSEDNETMNKNATQKPTEDGKEGETSEGEDSRTEEDGAEEIGEAGNVPFAQPPNLREVTFGQRPYNMAGNGPRYINILLEGEMEAPEAGGFSGGNSRKSTTEKKKFLGLIDRVAYSPLAEARAVVSNHESPAGVHLVRVKSSGAKRVPMSEMMIDAEAPSYLTEKKLRRFSTGSSLRRTGSKQLRSTFGGRSAGVDRETAGRRLKYREFGTGGFPPHLGIELPQPLHGTKARNVDGFAKSRRWFDNWRQQPLLR
ncbi:hypothetical protein Y032_0374g214 [Ancylostoma ceylanicum]|nr:hypothetical protein Y032_0374g214 [Ancylostoma ceylanicum]